MSSQPAGGANIDLQLSLLHTWTRFRVAEYYQNIFLAHLDELPSNEADNRIRLEIKATLQRASPFFILDRIHRNRRKLLQSLQDRLSIATTSLAQQELGAVCNELQQLRQLNLQAAEQILRMYSSLHCPSVEGADRQMEHYEQMFDSLDTDCLFLRESILNRYINFDDGYDPFFMSHYEQYHRSDHSNSPAVARLFSLPISYAYRLIKTKNLILQLRSQAAPRSHPEESRINDSLMSIKGKPMRAELLMSRPHDEWEGGGVSNRVSLRESLPLRIQPMHIYPAQSLKSRTTIYPSRQRPETATRTEAALSSQLKFSKMGSEFDSEPKMERSNRVYLPQDEENAMKSMRRESLRRQSAERQIIRDVRGRSYEEKPQRYKTQPIQNTKVTKLTPLRLRKNSKQYQNEIDSSVIRKRSEDEDRRRDKKIQYPTYQNIRHYNPIKGDQYQRKQQQLPKLPKYDFNPNLAAGETNLRVSNQSDDPGLLSEQPITKYSIKPKYFQKRSSDDDRFRSQKNYSNQTLSPSNPSPNQNNSNNTNNGNSSSTRNVAATIKKAEKVDQEAQTIDLKRNDTKEAKTNDLQPDNTTSKQSNQPNQSNQTLKQKQSNQETDPNQSSKPSQQKPAPNKSNNQPGDGQTIEKPKAAPKNKPNQNDVTLEDQDIIDQRPPKQQQPAQKKPLIRTVDKKDPTGKGQNIPDKKEAATANQKKAAQNANTSDKRQIRMKNGKSVVEEFVKLLGKGNLQPPLAGPQLEKLQMWIKQSQTYLTEFHVGDQLAVIALSSPIPGIGMALKLWARVDKLVDDTVSASLFRKYIEFVEKSTSVPKQVYSGAEFPELLAAGFVMKKEKLYERVRQLPAAESPSQFKPFIYIECSNVRFAQTTKQNMLYSEQIEEFSAENSFVLKSIGDVSAQQPDPLKPIVKVTEKMKDFKAVNELLTKEEFDNYEASQVSTNGVSVLRLTFNCPLRSTFLAQDGWLRVTGQLVHQKQKECIVSVGASLHSSTLFFGKGMQMAEFLDKVKTAPGAKAVFSVKMFSKKLYGRMIGFAGGCYGNWEVNLTWEDEMKGRIIHPITEGRCFGNQPFLVGIQIQKILVYCLQVGQDDFIF